MSTHRRNIAVTFAGGGNRAFYQMGLLHRWGERLHPRIASIASVSAGACVATLWLSGRESPTQRFWRHRRQGVTKNFDWTRMLRGRRPTPHAPIYRDTLMCAFSEGGLERIREQPFGIYIVTAKLPRGVGPTAATLLGFGAYNLEKRWQPRSVHPRWAKQLGFRPHIVDARDCETPEELTDLVIASSSTPPFTEVGSFRGRALLDGGLVDNVPAAAAEAGPTPPLRNLVLLTRPYPEGATGWIGNRLYVAPSEPVPIERWDYTRPELLDATIEMGESEAELHGPDFAKLLAC